MDNQTLRERLKDKKRIVVKVGSSSLTHAETGSIDLIKMEKLVRELTDLHNRGKEVILVSSGAIAVGRKTIGMKDRPSQLSVKQACASIGQARLMMMYQKFFMEYNQIASQVLMTKNTLVNGENRINARNTFDTLLHMGAIPIVNENDTISTYEIQFGDNDTLSAVVAALVQADLLILLSDIDGLFTDDPNKNPDAKFIDYVDHVDQHFEKMGKGSASDVGTGGMSTKLKAAKLATSAGADILPVIRKQRIVRLVQLSGRIVRNIRNLHFLCIRSICCRLPAAAQDSHCKGYCEKCCHDFSAVSVLFFHTLPLFL